MQKRRNNKRGKDFIQVTLLISLLFLYSYYETKRKEALNDPPTELSSLVPAPVLISSEQ